MLAWKSNPTLKMNSLGNWITMEMKYWVTVHFRKASLMCRNSTVDLLWRPLHLKISPISFIYIHLLITATLYTEEVVFTSIHIKEPPMLLALRYQLFTYVLVCPAWTCFLPLIFVLIYFLWPYFPFYLLSFHGPLFVSLTLFALWRNVDFPKISSFISCLFPF